MTKDWVDAAIDVATLRKRKKLPLHPEIPNPPKIGKKPKAGLPKRPKKKKVGGLVVEMPKPPQAVFQDNSARTRAVIADLADEVRILTAPPGVRRKVEIEMIVDRKRAEAAKALREMKNQEN